MYCHGHQRDFLDFNKQIDFNKKIINAFLRKKHSFSKIFFYLHDIWFDYDISGDNFYIFINCNFSLF